MSDRVDQFQALVSNQPDNSLFRFSLAQALLAVQRVPEAIQHLEICVEQKADWMLPRILLGKTLLKTGQIDRAKPLLETALQLATEQDHEDPAAELKMILAEI